MNDPHVFIVDDDPIALMILKKVIAKSNFHTAPLSFANGKLALDHFKATFSATERYVIFLDINMPVMNGWEFLDAVSVFATTDTTTVYLVTSSTDATDRNTAEGYPLVAEFLSKPVTIDMLKALK